MRMSNKTARQVLIIGVLLLFVVSCATFKQNAYNVLYTAGVSYDTAMSVAGDLYKQGKLTEDQKANIIKYATPFYSAYHGAVDAFEVWNTTQAAADKDKAIVALNAMLPKLLDLKNYLNLLNIHAFDAVIDRLDELNQLVKKIK